MVTLRYRVLVFILNSWLDIALCLFGVVRFLFQWLRYSRILGFGFPVLTLAGWSWVRVWHRCRPCARLASLPPAQSPQCPGVNFLHQHPHRLDGIMSREKKCIQALSYPTIRVELINLRSCKLDLPLVYCVTKNAEFSFPNAIVSLLVWFEFLSLVWTFKVYLSWTASDSRALVSSSCSRRCRWEKLFVRPKNFFTMRRPSILQTSIFSFFL